MQTLEKKLKRLGQPQRRSKKVKKQSKPELVLPEISLEPLEDPNPYRFFTKDGCIICVRPKGDIHTPQMAYQRFLELKGWDPFAVMAEAALLGADISPTPSRYVDCNVGLTTITQFTINSHLLPHPDTELFKNIPPFFMVWSGNFAEKERYDFSAESMALHAADYLEGLGYFPEAFDDTLPLSVILEMLEYDEEANEWED